MQHKYAKQNGSAAKTLGMKTVHNVQSDVEAEPGSVCVVDSSSNEVTITLPEASLCRGVEITIKKSSGENDTVITAADQIDGSAEMRIKYTGVSRTFVSDGDTWHVI